MTSMPVNQKVLAFCRKAFPGWKGRKARLRVSDKPMTLRSTWDGGSRDTFTGMELAGHFTVALPVSDNPFQPLKPAYIPASGVVVVEHTISCGKDIGCTLHVHPDDAARFVE